MDTLFDGMLEQLLGCSTMNESDPLYSLCVLDTDYDETESTNLTDVYYETGNDTYEETEDYEDEETEMAEFLVKRILFLVPVFLITLILLLMEKRKSACPKCCWGHFAMIIPANFLEVRYDRTTIVSAFGVITVDVVDMLSSNSALTAGHHPLVRVFIRMALVLVTCLLCLPFLICFAAGTYTSLILGLMYTLSYLTIRIMEDIPELQGDDPCDSVDSIIRELITVVFGTLMVFGYCKKLYYKIIKKPPKPSLHKFQRKYLKVLVTPQHRIEIKEATEKLEKLKGKCSTWCERKIYYKTKGFRYSLSILVSITIGMTVVTIMVGQLLEVTMCLDTFFGLLFNTVPPTSLLQRIPVPIVIKLLLKKVFKVDVNVEFKITLFDFLYDQYRIVFGSIYAAIGVTYILLIFAVLHMLRSYKENVLSIHQRKEDHNMLRIKTMSNPSIVVSAIQYCGYQVAYFAWGASIQQFTLIITFIVLAEAFVLPLKYAYWSVLEGIVNKIYPILVVMLLIKGTQRLLVTFVFLQEKGKVLALDNRKGFYNMMYFMFFYNIFLGLFSCLLRIIKNLIFGIWFLPRLDRSIFPKTFEHLDAGFKAYTCLLKLETLQSNAIVVGFTNILLNKGIFGIEKKPEERIRESQMELQKSKEKHRILARNRWFVAYTLVKNPQLIEKRGPNPFVNSIDEDEYCEKEFLTSV